MIPDASSLPSVIDRFKLFYSEDTLESKDFRDESIVVRCALKEMLNPPNTLQLAIASCAVQLLD